MSFGQVYYALTRIAVVHRPEVHFNDRSSSASNNSFHYHAFLKNEAAILWVFFPPCSPFFSFSVK